MAVEIARGQTDSAFIRPARAATGVFAEGQYNHRMAAYLQKRLVIAGAILLACGTLYNEIFLRHYNPISIIVGPYPLTPLIVRDIRWIQFCHLLAGLACVAIAFLLHRKAGPARKITRRLVSHLVTGFCFLALLLLIAECSLSPFIYLSNMHVEDEHLGWKLNPGVTSVWDGVRTSINEKGVRGSELAYEKPAGMLRILFLGDSVIFGYRIEEDQDTVPSLAARQLAAASFSVQSINAGVCGYSPWQEYEYLRREGIKYDPDLVVVSIVLNDVTDKMFLQGPGGQFEGFELLLSQTNRNRFWNTSHTGLYCRFLQTAFQLRHYMVLNRRFTRRPEHGMFREHLNATFTSIDRISAFCSERDVKLLFVLYPCSWQLQDESEVTPQSIIQAHLDTLNVPALDLLPVLRAAADYENDVEELFMDVWHMTPEGNALVAGRIAEAAKGLYLSNLGRAR